MNSALALVAAASALPPICTDRPTKANAICTVPEGKIQIETSAIGWSLTEADGSETRVLSVGSSFVKLGLSGRSDLQVGLTPYVQLTTKGGGVRDRVSGFGDVVVRYKHRLTRDDAKVQVGIIPFAKVPTAKRPIGNRKVEGGLAVPISFALTSPVTMTLGPEVDLLADGSGRHVALVNLVNISGPVAPRLTLAGELWTNFNFNPAGTIKQASADAALAYAVSDNLQLDAGANFGLTRETTDVEVYAGASIRF